MTDQFLLPGFEPEPQPKDRLFFAVLPDAAAAAQIGRLTQRMRAQHQLQGQPLDAARLHASLQALGDHVEMPHGLIARAGEAAATAAAAVTPFAVRFDQALSFSGRARPGTRRAVVLGGDDGIAGLSTLHQALTQAMLKAGLPASKGSFTPHVTMLYDSATVPVHSVDAVEWTVREFVLIHSLINASQPYTILKRWQLG